MRPSLPLSRLLPAAQPATAPSGGTYLAPICLVTVCLLTLFCGGAYANQAPALVGTWVINEERSADVQPEHLESRNWLGGGKLSTSVSVGGIPVPTGGQSKSKAMSDQPAKDPDILRCKRMHIDAAGDDLRMTYEEVGSELFRQGDYRGVTTRWSKRKLRSRYKTTTRKVTHALELQRDDSLLVTVTIKADGSRKRTYKQVFERESVVTGRPAAAGPEVSN